MIVGFIGLGTGSAPALGVNPHDLADPAARMARAAQSARGRCTCSLPLVARKAAAAGRRQ